MDTIKVPAIRKAIVSTGKYKPNSVNVFINSIIKINGDLFSDYWLSRSGILPHICTISGEYFLSASAILCHGFTEFMSGFIKIGRKNNKNSKFILISA